MKTGLILVTILCIVNFCISGSIYKKVLLDDSEALCLDGSPGAYYIS